MKLRMQNLRNSIWYKDTWIVRILTILLLLCDDSKSALLGECSENESYLNPANLDHQNITVKKRRSLNFPEGSSFVLTLQLLKAIQVSEPKNWNLDFEFDVTWPIFNYPYLQTEKRIKLRRRHRRQLYANAEFALNSQNLPGKQCILRLICEAKFSLNPMGISLIEDLLRVILCYPEHSSLRVDEYDVAYRGHGNCEKYYSCPFSLLSILLYYDAQLRIE